MTQIDSSFQTKAGRKEFNLAVGFCGLITSLLTAIALWWVEKEFHFALYSLMLWFIIPVGAILSGFVGASGYFLGAWFLGQRPNRLLLVNILLVSIVTYFFIHYLSYITLVIEGKQVSDYISFLKYLQIKTITTSMDVEFHGAKIGSTGELGPLRYGVDFLQIIGFAIGGFSIYYYLLCTPYCKKCFSYLRVKGRETRYSGDTEGLLANTVKIFEFIQNNKIPEAVEQQKSFGTQKYSKDTHLCSKSEIRCCKNCGQYWVNFSVEKKVGNNWSKLPKLTIAGFTNYVLPTTESKPNFHD